MIWQFTLLAVLSAIYVWHIFSSVDSRAALSGLFLVLLALCVEFLNAQLGPFWIAQESVYLISVGLPVEKLILYLVVGTFLCAAPNKYKDIRITRFSGRWASIFATGFLMTLLEFLLEGTEAFLWVRPWTMIGAFVYYSTGAYLLFRFYEASFRTKTITYSALAFAAAILGVVQVYSDQAFPLVSRMAFP